MVGGFRKLNIKKYRYVLETSYIINVNSYTRHEHGYLVKQLLE